MSHEIQRACGLHVTAEWPPDSRWNSYTISTRLTRAVDGATSPTDHVALMSCGRVFWSLLFREILQNGYVIRVDVARAVQRQSPWPRWCLDASQVDALIGSIADQPADQLSAMYPLSIWMLPNGRADAENAIDLFRALPNDLDAWHHVLRCGVGRVAVFDALADLVVPVDCAVMLYNWVIAAVDGARSALKIQLDIERK
jgi:hypothetical protein